MNTEENDLRCLFARDDDTVYPKQGVFLGGASPPDGEMKNGWRRKLIAKLKEDARLDADMLLVAPEPSSGNWKDIDHQEPYSDSKALWKKQTHWELQYLRSCDITTFWLPTYWTKKRSGVFAPNIGPSTRWEFGYFLQEYLHDQQNRDFIVGSPEDAQGIDWAKEITRLHGIKWHSLKNKDKSKLVADSFVDEIANTLIRNKYR
jgi:hypothetical protein